MTAREVFSPVIPKESFYVPEISPVLKKITTKMRS